MFNFDVRQMPFSKYGSFISVMKEKDEHTFLIRNCRKWHGSERALYIQFVNNGKRLKPKDIIADAGKIKITFDEGNAIIWLRGDEEIMVDAYNIDILMVPTEHFCDTHSTGNNSYIAYHYEGSGFSMEMKACSGKVSITKDYSNYEFTEKETLPFIVTKSDDNFTRLAVRITVNEELYVEDKVIDREKEIQEINDSWRKWLSNQMPLNELYRETAEMMKYNLWSAFIHKSGCFNYDACVMSKSWMCCVWSWDHCFNALALAYSGYIDSAVEQLLINFSHQDKNGKLPDYVNEEMISHNIVKPPIHGWCLSKIMDIAELDKDTLLKMYYYLEKWTNWHFNYRDSDNDGIPSYIIGADSGWDNSTIFDLGRDIESPDLSVYLAMQMNTLARICERLSKYEPAPWKYRVNEWKKRSEDLMQKLYQHSWKQDRFVAPQSGTHDYNEPTSMLTLMPIAGGKIIDKDKMKSMIDILLKNHLTDYGLATESLNSPKYRADGYWRGPIWAPTTYLIIDGLRDAGYTDIAKDIAKRFHKLILKSNSRENYNAITGDGLCDRGYTWSASVSICLMYEYPDLCK